MEVDLSRFGENGSGIAGVTLPVPRVSVISVPGPQGPAGPVGPIGPIGPIGPSGGGSGQPLLCYEYDMTSSGAISITIPGLSAKIESSPIYLWVNGILQSNSSYTPMDYGVSLPSNLNLEIGDIVQIGYYLQS